MPSSRPAGRYALVVALALAPLLPLHAQQPPAPVAAAAGTVEGRVRIGRALSTRRARFRVYAEPASAVAPATPAESQLANVVVYLEGVPAATDAATDATTDAAPRRAAMRQAAERFTPHVLAVEAGTTVDFPNADGIFHNVFSLSAAKTFDLGRYPRGESKAVTFRRPGVVQVFCHIHNDMSAFVLVLDSPAFAVPDADGRYAIPGVPPGEYTLVAWHERAAPIRRRVRVTAGGAVVMDVDIPIVDEDVRRE